MDLEFEEVCKRMRISSDDNDQTTERNDLITAIENLDVNRAHKLVLDSGIDGVNPIYLSRLLKRAIETDNERLVKDLLTKNPKLKTESRKSALWEAVLTGAMKVASMLVRNGADLTERHNFSNFLHLLVSSNDHSKHELAILMLNRGADIKVTDAVGNSVLHCAVRSNSTRLIKMLLEKGARIDVKNKYRENVLVEAACMPEARRLIKVLLETNTEGFNEEDVTRCIAEAIESHTIRKSVNLDAIRILCTANNFDVKKYCNNSQNSLAVQAILNGAKREVVDLLIELGSDLTLCNDRHFNDCAEDYEKLKSFIRRSVIKMYNSKRFRMNQKPTGNWDLIDFYEECLIETKNVKSIMINEHLPMMKVLTMSIKSLSWMIRNTNLIDSYGKIRVHIKESCPMYFKDLEDSFTKAKKRYKILSLKEMAFTEKLKNFLPQLVLDKIFFHLYMTYSVKITATKPVNCKSRSTIPLLRIRENR